MKGNKTRLGGALAAITACAIALLLATPGAQGTARQEANPTQTTHQTNLENGTNPSTEPSAESRVGHAQGARTKAQREAQQPGQRAPKRPNIVLIVTDDQRDGTLDNLPAIERELLAKGVNFTDAHSPTPTCCPARATLLTGNLAPRTGVWTNWLPYGGWQAFTRNGNENHTLAVALNNAGYRTGLFGKYLNGYGYANERLAETGSTRYIPPGWDSWFAFADPTRKGKIRETAYYDYWLLTRENNKNASYQRHTDSPKNYSTDVLGSEVAKFIRKTPKNTPLFAVYTPFAPHAPYKAAERDRGIDVGIERSDLNLPAKRAMADKPSWVSQRPGVNPARSLKMAQKQARALLAVDEQIGGIVEALKDTKRLKNTILVYVSDNGYSWGEYGLLGMKNFPYTTGIPMVMRWDNAPKGSALDRPGKTDKRLVALPDITQTLASSAGLTTFAGVDGLNLIDRKAERETLLITGWRNRGGNPKLRMPAWCGVLDRTTLYARYDRGYEELYDRLRDPRMERNLANTPGYPGTLEAMRQQTQELCNPVPPGFTWERPDPLAPEQPSTNEAEQNTTGPDGP